MCALFGFLSTKREVYADDFLADAFVTSMLRGTDSSGIASISLDGQCPYYVHKLPVNGLFFKEDKVAKRYMNYATDPNTLTLCHLRAATVGDVTLSNAHPFNIIKDNDQNLIGTHNGTLVGWKHLASAKGYDVDSEWALSRIAAEGVDAFKTISGAYAFVWWDSTDPTTLHMARNRDRPLFIALLEGGGMAYASEAGMLFWLLERNNIKIKGQILALDPDKHYVFPVSDPENFTSDPLPKAATSNSSNSNNYNGYGTNYTRTYLSCVDKVKQVIEEAANKSVVREATPAEERLARDYGWYGERAVFTQLIVNEQDDTLGMCETSSTEFDAIIRGDMTAMFDPNEEWLCTVVGVAEEGNDMTLILSKPYKTIPMYEPLN